MVATFPPRPDRRRLPSRKVVPLPIAGLSEPDSVQGWTGRRFPLVLVIGGVSKVGVPAPIVVAEGDVEDSGACLQFDFSALGMSLSRSGSSDLLSDLAGEEDPRGSAATTTPW
jgi:hypothetical protein